MAAHGDQPCQLHATRKHSALQVPHNTAVGTTQQVIYARTISFRGIAWPAPEGGGRPAGNNRCWAQEGATHCSSAHSSYSAIPRTASLGCSLQWDGVSLSSRQLHRTFSSASSGGDGEPPGTTAETASGAADQVDAEDTADESSEHDVPQQGFSGEDDTEKFGVSLLCTRAFSNNLSECDQPYLV